MGCVKSNKIIIVIRRDRTGFVFIYLSKCGYFAGEQNLGQFPVLHQRYRGGGRYRRDRLHRRLPGGLAGARGRHPRPRPRARRQRDLVPRGQLAEHPAQDRQADSHRGGRLRVAAAVAAGARAGLAAGGAAV